MSDSEGDLTGCRVLIVEDDGMLAMLLQEQLAAIGCKVTGCAARLDEAARKCDDADAFDVALLDVNLRGEQTFPIAQAMLERGQTFVLATGYSETVLPDDLRASPLLQKPYRKQELGTALWDALHR